MFFVKDADLIESCLASDETAWEDLVERYNQLVYAIPCHFGFATADADAIFQETFTVLLRNLSKLRRTPSLTQWLIATTYRECQKCQNRLGQPSTELKHPLSESLSRQWHDQQGLRMALAQIDADCRLLLDGLFSSSANSPVDPVIHAQQIQCFGKLEKILAQFQGK